MFCFCWVNCYCRNIRVQVLSVTYVFFVFGGNQTDCLTNVALYTATFIDLKFVEFMLMTMYERERSCTVLVKKILWFNYGYWNIAADFGFDMNKENFSINARNEFIATEMCYSTLLSINLGGWKWNHHHQIRALTIKSNHSCTCFYI